MMQNLTIGAVSNLTGIPAHTLRKWEDRHGIAVPERTETGRRVYTEEQVEVLRLTKQLVANGHSLTQLSDLNVDQLHVLLDKHNEDSEVADCDHIVLVGPSVSLRLSDHAAVQARYSGSLYDWLSTEPELTKDDALVVETQTIPEPLFTRLLEIAPTVKAMVVVYKFASSHTLRELKAANVRATQGHASDEDLLAQLSVRSNQERQTLVAQRFDAAELARIAAMSPGLQCECPNHLAQLIMDLSSFEAYSAECVANDPKARALHTQLGEMTGRARGIIEDALMTVAAADGIALRMRSG